MAISTKELNNGKIALITPFNRNFINDLKAKVGGAKWDSSNSWWTIPAESLETARTIMMDCYGETDITEDADKFSVKFSIEARSYNSTLDVFGKALVIVKNHDYVIIGDGFELVDGTIYDAGSRRKPQAYAHGTFIAHRITQAQLDKEIQERGSFEYEILKESSINVEALKAERAKLIDRIAEIDKLLNQ